MNRHLKLSGIVISNYRIQDYNKGVKIFTPELGVFSSIAYGGYRPRSRLGSLLQPVTYGEFDIYHDPVKKIYKISDYEPLCDYLNIKNDLTKYYCILLWFEIILKSHSGGEARDEIYDLLHESMNLLEKCSDEKRERLMIQFLMRVIIFFGGPFQLNECCNCGTIIKNEDYLYYSIRDLGFLCRNCAKSDLLEINPGTRKYIDYSSGQKIEVSLNSGIEKNNQKELKIFLYRVIQEYLEDSLTTLNIGREFLV